MAVAPWGLKADKCQVQWSATVVQEGNAFPLKTRSLRKNNFTDLIQGISPGGLKGIKPEIQ